MRDMMESETCVRGRAVCVCGGGELSLGAKEFRGDTGGQVHHGLRCVVWCSVSAPAGSCRYWLTTPSVIEAQSVLMGYLMHHCSECDCLPLPHLHPAPPQPTDPCCHASQEHSCEGAMDNPRGPLTVEMAWHTHILHRHLKKALIKVCTPLHEQLHS